MVRNGMSTSRAVRCGTSEAARLAGVFEQVGSLEPGKLADLIVVDGDPLEDISVLQHGIQLVMKGGTIYRDDLATVVSQSASDQTAEILGGEPRPAPVRRSAGASLRLPEPLPPSNSAPPPIDRLRRIQ